MAQRKPYNTIAAATPTLSSVSNNILNQNATTNFIGLNKPNPISQLDVVGDIRAYTANNQSGVLLSSSGGVYASSKLVLGADLGTIGTGVDGSAEGDNNMPTWSLPSTFASRGFFRINTTRSSSLGNPVNINTLAANAVPTGMTLDPLPTGNNIQFIRLTDIATYIMNWSINLSQTGGSAGLLQFNVFVGGVFSQFQQLYLNGAEPIAGSFIFTTIAPNTTLNIEVLNQSSVAFDVTGSTSPAYSQISILKI